MGVFVLDLFIWINIFSLCVFNRNEKVYGSLWPVVCTLAALGGASGVWFGLAIVSMREHKGYKRKLFFILGVLQLCVMSFLLSEIFV